MTEDRFINIAWFIAALLLMLHTIVGLILILLDIIY